MAKVILICGKICCGKTTYAHALCRQEKAVLLSCDELMLSLLDEYLGEQHEVYAQRTEAYLLRKSLEILQTGISVVLDWGPWTKAGRDRLKAFYAQHGIRLELHAIRLEEEKWRARIAVRNAAVRERTCQAYSVDAGLLDKFQSHYEAPSADEVNRWIDL
ncbi:MAG: ATP-binding protein [Clostridia bacterium]|nr:ATP-binding protein [Clostridia bacterium]